MYTASKHGHCKRRPCPSPIPHTCLGKRRGELQDNHDCARCGDGVKDGSDGWQGSKRHKAKLKAWHSEIVKIVEHDEFLL